MENKDISGFLLINKPAGISSYDCIRNIKKFLSKKTKIGHSGTLDNFATGLLIICISRQATKLASQLSGQNKEYIVKAKLGQLTDTLDHTGKVLYETKEKLLIFQQALVQSMESLQPSYLQIPPIYSALKHKGTPLYKLARTKKLDPNILKEIVKQKSRSVSIYHIELLDFSPPFFTFKAHVSKGTYIRSLAHDIAQKINLPATTYQLERTRINKFTLSQAVLLKDIKTVQDLEKHLISIEEMKSRIQESENII